jgi:hypothetical protein
MPRLKPPHSQLYLCGCCLGRYADIARELPRGLCPRCGHELKGGCVLFSSDVATIELHPECAELWFAKDDSLSPGTVAYMFLQRERKRRDERVRKTAAERAQKAAKRAGAAIVSPFVPPDDAA